MEPHKRTGYDVTNRFRPAANLALLKNMKFIAQYFNELMNPEKTINQTTSQYDFSRRFA